MNSGQSDSKIRFIEEPARQTPIRHIVDVLVVGGGSSGIAAATAAARLGANVLLVENNGYLGGTLSMVTVGSICGLYAVAEDKITAVVRGFTSEIVDRLRRMGGAREPKRWLKTASMPYDPSMLKIAADEIVNEAGVRLAFHCLAIDVWKEGNEIRGVIFQGRDGRWGCAAGIIIDCTGDGDIAAMAGACFEYVPALIQAPTTMFRFGGVDVERASQLTRDDIKSRLEQAVAAGLPLPRTAGGAFSNQPGSMHLNITRVLKNGRSPDSLNTEELTEAELQGRQQLKLYLQAFREFVPGYENCVIAEIGSQIGIRESRRVRGEYWLTLDDALKQGRFEDAVACSAWPVEEHGGGRATKWVFLSPGTYYQLPFRMMLPLGCERLLVAGRCASASHDAHASMRVAAVCMALGEAAGVAAVLSFSSACSLRQLDIAALQRQLIRQGAFLGADIT